MNANKMVVAVTDFPKIKAGTVTEQVSLANGKQQSFTFVYEDAQIINAVDCFSLNGNSVIVNTSSSKATSDIAAGYGTLVKADLQVTYSTPQGGFWMYIGSYGIHCRGGSWRIWSIDTDGKTAEVCRPDFAADPNLFTTKGTLYFSVKLIDEKTVRLTFKTDTGSAQTSYSYDVTRIDKEISNENANIMFSIRTDCIESLTIYKAE